MKGLAGGLIGFGVVLGLVTFSVAGVPCAGTSVVEIGSPGAGIGDTVNVYATIKDCYGDPLAGLLVDFRSTRPSLDTFIGSPAVTDDEGKVCVKMTSTTPGLCCVYAICEGVEIGPSWPPFPWYARRWRAREHTMLDFINPTAK